MANASHHFKTFCFLFLLEVLCVLRVLCAKIFLGVVNLPRGLGIRFHPCNQWNAV